MCKQIPGLQVQFERRRSCWTAACRAAAKTCNQSDQQRWQSGYKLSSLGRGSPLLQTVAHPHRANHAASRRRAGFLPSRQISQRFSSALCTWFNTYRSYSRKAIFPAWPVLSRQKCGSRSGWRRGAADYHWWMSSNCNSRDHQSAQYHSASHSMDAAIQSRGHS